MLPGGGGGEFEDRAVQSMARVPDLKLSRMDPDGEASDSGVEVVARHRPLVTLREASLAVEGEGMGGYHLTREKVAAEVHGQNWPVRVSKCVGLPSSLPPCRT
jgi:hypothetical protein